MVSLPSLWNKASQGTSLTRGKIRRMQEELEEEALKGKEALYIKLNWQLQDHSAQGEARLT